MPHNRVQLFEIGELDDDHLRLAAIIAEMELYVDAPELGGNAGQLLERLLEAARGHFELEGQLVARTGYALLAPHQEAHAELLRFIEALIERVASGQLRVDTS